MAKLPTKDDVSASLLDAAKTSAEGVRTLTGEALGAAAAAAAGVVLEGVSRALGKGEATVSGATPAVTETVKDTVTGAIVKKPRKRRAAKRVVAKRSVAKKRTAPKAAKRRAAKKASAKKKSARPQAKRKAKTKKAESSTKRKAKKNRR
jgi:hypothetical protein